MAFFLLQQIYQTRNKSPATGSQNIFSALSETPWVCAKLLLAPAAAAAPEFPRLVGLVARGPRGLWSLWLVVHVACGPRGSWSSWLVVRMARGPRGSWSAWLVGLGRCQPRHQVWARWARCCWGRSPTAGLGWGILMGPFQPEIFYDPVCGLIARNRDVARPVAGASLGPATLSL